MYQKIVSILVVAAFLTAILGCASVPEEHEGAATGAAVGAAAGVVAGALLGSKGAKTEMAILGGLLGALAGGAIGHYAYDQKRTGEETAQNYKYDPSQGTMVRIERASASPDTVKPGETVELTMTYALLSSSSNDELNITEIREIRYGAELYGKPQVNLTRLAGTYSSSIPLTLPDDAKKGRYSVIVTVQALNVSDSKEATFYVK